MFDTSAGGGLFAALKNIVGSVLASGRTRLELLANEIQEEKLRAINLLIFVFGTVFCLSAACLLAVLFLTVLFWEARLWVLGLSCGVLLVAGLVFLALFRRERAAPERLFAASLAELQEDLNQLKASMGSHADAE